MAPICCDLWACWGHPTPWHRPVSYVSCGHFPNPSLSGGARLALQHTRASGLVPFLETSSLLEEARTLAPDTTDIDTCQCLERKRYLARDNVFRKEHTSPVRRCGKYDQLDDTIWRTGGLGPQISILQGSLTDCTDR